MAGNDTVIQQTLHGYREGHRLLAASILVPPTTEQTMAVLSDLSGHGMVRRFDEYLTGYGLPEVGAYALAKTWYAPEMPRPGCVWTHTLLIPFARLGKAPSLHTFVRLFKRPSVDQYEEYNEPCTESPLEGHDYPPKFVVGEAMQFEEVIYRLYDAPAQTVIVPIESSALAEVIFLEIWSQQWPRLRRSFTFCTGAISGRRIEGEWFDLLGVPTGRFDDIRRTIKDSVVAELDVRPALDESENWLDAVLEDLGSSAKKLRAFMFEYGAEAGNGRRDFVPMTELFLALNDSRKDQVRRVVAALREIFPRVNMGSKLKGRLLSGEVGSHGLRIPSTPLHLILLSGGALFDTTAAQLESLARRSWAHDAAEVIGTIDGMIEQNATVDETAIGILAETLESSEVARIGKWSRGLGRLISYRPMILAHEVLSTVEGRDLTLLEYLSSSRATKGEMNVVLRQWLKEGEFGHVEAASEQQPKVIVPKVLNLMITPREQDGRGVPTDLLIRLCRRFPDEVTKWLKRNIVERGSRPVECVVIGCIVVGVEYKKIPIVQANVDAWENFIENRVELDLVVRDAAIMQLFLKAMQLRGGYAARIATATFPHIFHRLRGSKLSYGEWYTLQEEVIGFGWDWDRCRRLAEGLIDHFREFEWPRKNFVDMIARDDDLAREIRNIRFYRSRYDKFVRRSLKDVGRPRGEG